MVLLILEVKLDEIGKFLYKCNIKISEELYNLGEFVFVI